MTRTRSDQFHRDGVLVVRDVLDAAEVAALRADVDATVAKGVARKGEGHSYRHVDGRDQYFRADGVGGYGKAFRDITVKPEILAIVDRLLGHPFVPVKDTTSGDRGARAPGVHDRTERGP